MSELLTESFLRATFWFVCIGSLLSFTTLVLYVLLHLDEEFKVSHANSTSRLFPETLRSLVGNGSIEPSPFYRPLIPVIGRASRLKYFSTERPPPRKFKNPLRLFLFPDVALLLFVNGVLYAVFYAVITTISTVFADTYPYLNETKIGLCFLGIGTAMFIGSFVTGRLTDSNYQTVKKQYIKQLEKDSEKPVDVAKATKDIAFPIEKARLRSLPLLIGAFCACVIGYGWMLEAKVNIAGPLIFQIASG
jgi:hypothetical protein